MTAYIEGPTRAHVMRFAGAPGQWRSFCNYGPDYDGPAWYAAHPNLGDERPPLRHTEETPPGKPWCLFCLRRVRDLAESVGLI